MTRDSRLQSTSARREGGRKGRAACTQRGRTNPRQALVFEQSVAADKRPAVARLRGLPWRLPLNANVGRHNQPSRGDACRTYLIESFARCMPHLAT